MRRFKAGYLRPLDYTPHVLAEDRGIEPLSPLRSHGLANRCIAALPIFLMRLTAGLFAFTQPGGFGSRLPSKISGAQGGLRTPMPRRAPDSESGTSANFATWASIQSLVPGAGFEPARTVVLHPLKVARLPVSPPGRFLSGGGHQIRTDVVGFAIQCLTAGLDRQKCLLLYGGDEGA